MSWSRVKGHEALVKSFQEVIGRGRLAHAYLLTGPPGIGKKLFSIELAKTLLCENAPTGRPPDSCDTCPGCVQVEAGTHPDYQLVGLPEEAHEFPIKLMKEEVLPRLSMKPARGRYRIAILDDADDLSEEAANSFLKTLEEPPPASLLILLSTSPDRQLATIVSRCQIIRFAPLSEAMIVEHLVKEGVVANAAEAQRLARFAGGSLSDAKALADPELWRLRRELLVGLAQPRIDSVALATRLNKFIEEETKDTALRRSRANQLIKFLAEFLRLSLHVQLGQKVEQSDAEDLKAARQLASRADSDSLMEALDRCLLTGWQVDRRLQLALVLEAMMDAVGQPLQGTKAG